MATKTTRKKTVRKKATRKKKTGGNRKPAPKVIRLEPEDPLDSLRDSLSAVDRLIFEKAREALSSEKAVTTWPKMMEVIKQISDRYSTDDGEQITVSFDDEALLEASGA